MRTSARRPRGPQARPRDSVGGLLRVLLPTVGIGLLFLIVAFRAFSGPGQPGPEATAATDVLATAAPTDTPGPTPTPVPRAAQGDLGKPLIAIVAGHSGINPSSGLPDPGSLCPDGLAEVQITTAVAARVAQGMQAHGYPTVVLEEFDQRTAGLRATAFLSIHVDSCEVINDEATGFKVSGPVPPRDPTTDHQRLTDCITQRYATATGLHFHDYSITHDMTRYHSFGEIDARTPAAIIELGFLNLDRKILTERQDLMAQALVDGLLCFLQTP
jgi:N-acetylmuramoyl-L-alanine amidase